MIQTVNIFRRCNLHISLVVNAVVLPVPLRDPHYTGRDVPAHDMNTSICNYPRSHHNGLCGLLVRTPKEISHGLKLCCSLTRLANFLFGSMMSLALLQLKTGTTLSLSLLSGTDSLNTWTLALKLD